MTDVSITAEDRERLAKGKFIDWLFEGVDDDRIGKKLDERIDQRITNYAQGARPQQQQQQQQPQGDNIQQMPTRKRSLLEECLSQTFGF